MKKRILSIILAFVLLVSLSACSMFTGSQMRIKYVSVEGGLKVKTFEGTSQEVDYTIPDEKDGEAIVELGDFSISNNEYIKILRIGKNIKRISNRAITNNSILEQIIVDPENENYMSINGVLFTKDQKELIAYPNSANPRYIIRYDETAKKDIFGSKYTVPEGVETISEMAFYRCYSLTNITLPTTLKNINEMAFFKTGLHDISIPDGVLSIKRDAFSFTKINTETTIPANEIFIPASVTEIGADAFCGCDSVKVFKMERASLDGMTLGKNWMPYKSTAKNLIFSQTRRVS